MEPMAAAGHVVDALSADGHSTPVAAPASPVKAAVDSAVLLGYTPAIRRLP